MPHSQLPALPPQTAEQALLGLDYVHKHAGIHRDIKAGELLVCWQRGL
jgi:hypothetical protein